MRLRGIPRGSGEDLKRSMGDLRGRRGTCLGRANTEKEGQGGPKGVKKGGVMGLRRT